MNYVQYEQKNLMKKNLLKKAELTHKDLEDMIYSFQIVSGNPMGSGKIMGILDFLQEGNPVTFIHANGKVEVIQSKFDLAQLIKSVDNLIDLTTSRIFKEYF